MIRTERRMMGIGFGAIVDYATMFGKKSRWNDGFWKNEGLCNTISI